jgi:hypothetical protein
MNVFELIFFILILTVSIVIGRYLFPIMGWWCVLPAGILGFGVVTLVLIVIPNLFGRRPRANKDE